MGLTTAFRFNTSLICWLCRNLKLKNNEVFESVWDALEDSPVDAQCMKIRSGLLVALRQHLGKQQLTQPQATLLLCLSQPQASHLYRGKISEFGTDELIRLALKAGLKVEIKTSTLETV